MEDTSLLMPQLVRPEQYPIVNDRTDKSSPFIEANTVSVSLSEMKDSHMIPVFTKDNEPLISHVEFVEATREIMASFYDGEEILGPTVRVSHPVKGRVPEAKYKSADDLLPWEKTLYYERMMFAIEVPSYSEIIDGNQLSLTVGGVKTYNKDNLYSRSQCDQHFKLFVGFQNKICTNMCVWTDGFMSDVRVKDLGSLQMHLQHLLERYRISMHLEAMKDLVKYTITERQFAQFIGKCRMFQHLPASKKAGIKEVLFGDQQLGMVAKDYYKDKSFCRQPNGTISLWKLYNLLTGANKSTYVDQFLDRSVNAYDIAEQLRWAVEGRENSWYLS
jgi:hypothetical protein